VSVPAGRLLTLEEALGQEQIAQRELLHDVEVGLPDRRTVTVLGSGVHVDGESLAPSTPPPTLGQHTEQILVELGYSNEEITALRGARVV
jgi:crotonobetainyl-CoA:carnitine CoA-transferase CaiB-like acyl-CoA transferase